MADAARSGPAAAELPPLQGGQLLLLSIAIAASTFMEILDTTIVNVSVPAIAGSLGVSPSEATWTVSSYALAAAIVQPLTGWLGRRFGEVRTFVVSMLLFVATSAACGFAPTMTVLVAGRVLQGLVSGPMVALAQALLLRIPRRSAVPPWHLGMVAVVARSAVRCWVAGSPTISPGRGCSTSMFRSGCWRRVSAGRCCGDASRSACTYRSTWLVWCCFSSASPRSSTRSTTAMS
jgi:MFS family permease